MSNEILKDFLYYWVFIPLAGMAYSYGCVWTLYTFINFLPWPFGG